MRNLTSEEFNKLTQNAIVLADDEYGKKVELLSRPLSEIYDHLRDFSVYVNYQENKLQGCCALK